jgi:methyl-accepting chemotaxis protein
MFVKFLVGCFTLAALLIVGITFLLKEQAKPPSQGNFLARTLRRYQGYEDRAGRGLTGALEVLADDPRLRRLLEGGIGAAAPGEGNAATTGDAIFAKLSSKNNAQPDFVAIFSTNNELVYASPGAPIKRDDLPELAAAEHVRAGSTFAHALTMLGDVPYQVSAMPVRGGVDGEVIGGIVAGVRVERIFDEFSDQSDEVVEHRTRPTIVRGQEILASAWPNDQWSALARALQLDRVTHQVVSGADREVVRIGSGDFFFYDEPIEAYEGLKTAPIGKIFITRSSTTEPVSRIPWPELGVALVLSIAIAAAMAYWITRPIKQFVRQSGELLKGDTDLTQRIVVRSRDETADLADNINQVFERLHGLATGVQTAAFQVGASSAEISAASRQMLSGIKDQSVKIESSTAAITELSASIQQVAENAAQATDMANKSNSAVTAAVQRMEQIRGAVDDAADKMRDLGESSKRIGNIVEAIRQISEQTSLLALNAAIQAAQAGEQGRGFAVVADEVSSLARRAGQSAKDIEALIQTIKEQTAAAVASMDKGTVEVESGTLLVSATLGDLGKLIGVVHDTAQAVQEQAVVSDEIAHNMDAVQKIAAEVLTGSEESVVQAERLHELAFELEESIGGFNLEGGKAGKSSPPAEPSGPRKVDARSSPRSLPAKSERPRALGRPQPRRG